VPFKIEKAQHPRNYGKLNQNIEITPPVLLVPDIGTEQTQGSDSIFTAQTR
jgi:hypothetical protein